MDKIVKQFKIGVDMCYTIASTGYIMVVYKEIVSDYALDQVYHWYRNLSWVVQEPIIAGTHT